ncbi:MAG: polymer-forming cytoskeletal protein [Proteobacteria bacterium]|nr:polymer-forming cytoskeletal protein [Pseudomonadota bacterium]
MSRGKVNASDIIAFLGPETDFNGKLFFEGSVRLDGKFKGEIMSPGVLIVGESAEIEADINVGTAVISGQVMGQIVAQDQVVLHYPGRLLGDIKAPSVVVDEGVLFDGRCQMLEGDQSLIEPGKVTYLSPSES